MGIGYWVLVRGYWLLVRGNWELRTANWVKSGGFGELLLITFNEGIPLLFGKRFVQGCKEFPQAGF